MSTAKYAELGQPDDRTTAEWISDLCRAKLEAEAALRGMLPSPNKWGTVDHAQWAVVRLAPLTASGYNEILSTERTKALAEDWAMRHYGRLWRAAGVVTVVRKGGR